MKITILLLLVMVCSCSDAKDKLYPSGDNPNTFISKLKLPDKLQYCGEEIPLSEPEVFERAEREFYVNLQQPGQMILYIKRAGKYFPLFEKLLKEYNMPDDIKYLAVAESALMMARSPKEAVGIWQFIESTGRQMGLQIDEFVDERRNVEKSTRAALEYLKLGYQSNHNSWILAAAGYNMGHANVTENLDFQMGDDFFDLYLNEETSRYILRLAIIKEIMEHPEKYGFNIEPERKYQPEKTKIIKVYNYIDNLAEWAKENNTTYKTVKLLNPWILKRRLPTPAFGKCWEIEVPEK